MLKWTVGGGGGATVTVTRVRGVTEARPLPSTDLVFCPT